MVFIMEKRNNWHYLKPYSSFFTDGRISNSSSTHPPPPPPKKEGKIDSQQQLHNRINEVNIKNALETSTMIMGKYIIFTIFFS